MNTSDGARVTSRQNSLRGAPSGRPRLEGMWRSCGGHTAASGFVSELLNDSGTSRGPITSITGRVQDYSICWTPCNLQRWLQHRTFQRKVSEMSLQCWNVQYVAVKGNWSRMRAGIGWAGHSKPALANSCAKQWEHPYRAASLRSLPEADWGRRHSWVINSHVKSQGQKYALLQVDYSTASSFNCVCVCVLYLFVFI